VREKEEEIRRRRQRRKERLKARRKIAMAGKTPQAGNARSRRKDEAAVVVQAPIAPPAPSPVEGEATPTE